MIIVPSREILKEDDISFIAYLDIHAAQQPIASGAFGGDNKASGILNLGASIQAIINQGPICFEFRYQQQATNPYFIFPHCSENASSFTNLTGGDTWTYQANLLTLEELALSSRQRIEEILSRSGDRRADTGRLEAAFELSVAYSLDMPLAQIIPEDLNMLSLLLKYGNKNSAVLDDARFYSTPTIQEMVASSTPVNPANRVTSALWRSSNQGGSVKRSEFVLRFHEFFQEYSNLRIRLLNELGIMSFEEYFENLFELALAVDYAIDSQPSEPEVSSASAFRPGQSVFRSYIERCNLFGVQQAALRDSCFEPFVISILNGVDLRLGRADGRTILSKISDAYLCSAHGNEFMIDDLDTVFSTLYGEMSCGSGGCSKLANDCENMINPT